MLIDAGDGVDANADADADESDADADADADANADADADADANADAGDNANAIIMIMIMMMMVKWKWNRIALHSTTIYYLYDRCCIVDVVTTGDNDIWIQIQKLVTYSIWVPSHIFFDISLSHSR